jgi:hypothetical protein
VMRGFRTVCGRIANIKDSLLERAGFELSGDFVNGQLVIRSVKELKARCHSERRAGPQSSDAHARDFRIAPT